MRKLAWAVLAAMVLIAAVPAKADPLTPVALPPAPEVAAEPTYFGMSRQTAFTVAAVGAASLVGGAAIVYSVAGASGLFAAAGAVYASHFVVEAALLAGAGGAWLGFVSPAESQPVD